MVTLFLHPSLVTWGILHPSLTMVVCEAESLFFDPDPVFDPAVVFDIDLVFDLDLLF